MGVQGLWKLLESAGKPIPVEKLENKVLSIGILLLNNNNYLNFILTQCIINVCLFSSFENTIQVLISFYNETHLYAFRE